MMQEDEQQNSDDTVGREKWEQIARGEEEREKDMVEEEKIWWRW